MLDRLQCHQQILFDLTANYLEPLDGSYQRLAYLANLCDTSTGKYVHEVLASFYSAEAVNHVVAHCHEEIFERLLEMPLNAQEQELRAHLSSLPGDFAENLARCKTTCGNWAPVQAPKYLKELYSANLRVLLELLRDDRSKAHPNS
jgi:hypothetical protein